MTAEDPIPLFAHGSAKKVKAITCRYQLSDYPDLGQALTTIYFRHRDLWSSEAEGSKVLKRSATKINSATRKYMSVLSSNATFAMLLGLAVGDPEGSTRSVGDINTLTSILTRLLRNSATAMQATTARGRRKDPLAVTVSAELWQFYDKSCPPNSRAKLPGESRGDLRARFVRDAAALLGVRLTEDSIRTYRETWHVRRVRS